MEKKVAKAIYITANIVVESVNKHRPSICLNSMCYYTYIASM